ncbi:dystroglycan-like isoform X2 [Dendronephthya gigantea]|uniref:dystroglycan-like isoform X2 n=1 Tax=Dendronephthya gigantea TaxID=151771 RepID=UPI00106BDA9E|nr:dystroglycan-like isoform X2 [Dendronephthya gigantea]
MLLLVIFLFTFFKSSYLSAEYPQVVPSPSISHGRNNAIMREKECFVGKLCEYEILAEDFSCNVSEYVPSSGPERTLPKWLWLDKEVQTVKGIPSPSDEGTSELLIIGLRRHQYSAIGNICGLLTVKIVVWCLRYFPLFTRDIPTSAVIDGELSTTPPWKSIACQPNEPIVLASLVLAGNFHEMDGKRKINILDELLQNDHVSLYDVFILSSTEKETLSGLLRTSHVLGSGPGANRSSTGPSTTITWLARCGIIHLDDSLFQAIEQLAQRSVLINNIRYAPIGWHLVTGFQKNIRRKRNIVGTTTPAYSTIPISRATVITTRIKITRTRYVSQTRAITLSRPLPTFSSPFPANNTSLLNMSTTVTSQYSNTRDSSQHKNISSTLPVMSLTNTLFSLSQIISPSKRVTSEISQYESVNSISSVMSVSKNMSPILQSLSSSQTLEMQSETLPVVSQSTNKSILLDQISSSKQQVSGSKISHSTKMSFHLQSTLAQTRSFNLSTAFQSPSVRSSLTTIWNQRSTYTVEPSRRGITSSIPLSALQTATNTIGPFSTLEDSRGTISSSITTSLPKSEQHSISTFRISSLASSVKTVVVKLNYSTIPLQTSYSKYIDSVKLFSSRTYSPASQNITTSRIVNETKSTVISQTSYENSIVETRSSTAMASSDTITTTQRLETPSPSQSSYVTSLSSETRYKPPNPTSTSFLSCAQSRCESITRKLSRSSVSTASLYLTSSIARETIYKTSRITGTLVLKTAKETPQSSDMGKIYSRTLLTPRTVSTSLESSNYRFSKIIKTSESINPMMYSSRSSTMESSQISSSRAKSSQVLSEDRKESILASSSTEKSTSTGRTPPHITTELRSPHSRLIKHSPVSSISVQSRTTSSQPSITPELSIMMPSASSIYTSTKLLLFPSTRLSQPSYPSKQSPRTVLLTHTSAKMPAITSSPGQLSSTTSSQSSSSAVTSPTTSLKESPKLYNDFDSLSVNVGEVFSVKIPADTFHDREDGNTRNLRLDCLTVDHEKLPKDSWLQFNSTTQKLYGLILKNQLEGHSTEYILTASDNDGNTVYDAFSVNVERRTIPLAAIFSVRLTKTNLEMFNKDLSNILSIVQNIAGYYGDKDESLVRVESVTKGSVLFTWRNTTFKSCDNDLINDTASKLVTTQGNIQPDFYNVFLPKFRATDVFINYTGPCAVSSTKNPRAAELSSSETSPWLKYVLPVVLVAAVIIIIAVVLLVLRQHSGSKILKEDKQIFKRRKPTILDGELEMSTLSGKPIELPEDSLTPIRFPRETPLETPEDYEDDIPKLPSPILSAPSYQRLSPRYNDKGSNRYDSPPPSYRLPPSYYSSIA